MHELLELKEVELVDEWGDFAAIRVNLDDVVEFLKKIDESLTAKAEFEDYDDYGCEHFVRIKGECADIILDKDYGGIYCQTDSLVCKIEPHTFRNKETGIDYFFELKKQVPSVNIGRNYANQICKYLEQHKQYLKGDKQLFTRTDYLWYKDQRGTFKLNISSYDSIELQDVDFHTGKKKDDLWYQQRKSQFHHPTPTSPDTGLDFI